MQSSTKLFSHSKNFPNPVAFKIQAVDFQVMKINLMPDCYSF